MDTAIMNAEPTIPQRSLAQIYLDWLYNAPVEELIGKCEPLPVGGGEWSIFVD